MSVLFLNETLSAVKRNKTFTGVPSPAVSIPPVFTQQQELCASHQQCDKHGVAVVCRAEDGVEL